MDKERKDQPGPAEPGNPIGQIGDTVRIRRPPRVFTTVLGQNIWMGDVEPCDLELEHSISTDPYDSGGSADDPWSRV